MPTRDATYEQAVTAWTEHLRAGGTTDWSAWRETDQPEGADDLHPLPDAIHLELVRRINLAAEDDPDLGGLADRVLSTATPGRGLLDVPLPWPSAPRRFGTPPIDPAALPEEELIRLAVGVLAHLLPDVPQPTPEALPTPWPLPWRRRFRLHGSPGTAAAVRMNLFAQGLVETDWRPTHIVIARPVPVMMAEWWATSVRDGGILKWSTAWRRAEAAGRLPPSIDVTGIADQLASRDRSRGSDRVHVVVASGADEAAAVTAEILGARPAELQESGDAAVSDLLRRLNRLSALTHGPGRARELAQDPGDHAGRGDDSRPDGHHPCAAARFVGLGGRAGGVHRRGDPPGWLRCARRTGRPDPNRPPAARHRRPRTHPGAGHHGLLAELAPERQLVTRRVLLHVGAPKTGTSFVQDILFTHRATLRERGILYPADRHDAHFLAALDLMELPWGGLEREAGGAWDRLVAEVRDWPGTAIISHEILGTASRVQVARALDSLGANDDTEIHIVYSARDLVRQIPAEWQENVKHRRVKPYGRFLENLRDEQRSAEVAQWFWGVQEVPDVLDRWAESIPRDRVHLVTVPPPGSNPTLLWERFAGLFGIDPQEFAPTNKSNASLGVPESAMVRRLNERLNDVLPNHHYRSLVRELLVHRNLSGRPGSPRLSLPEDAYRWASDLGRSWVSELALRGYDVVGELDDLVPGPALPFTDPDDCDEREVSEAAIDALAIMTNESARLRDVEAELHGVIEDLTGQLERFRGTRTYRAKERLVAMSHTNPLARFGLAVYRRLRGKSSRST